MVKSEIEQFNILIFQFLQGTVQTENSNIDILHVEKVEKER